MPVEGSPERFELCLLCDDVDAATARLRAAGATQLPDPENMPWGERLVYFARTSRPRGRSPRLRSRSVTAAEPA